MKYLFALLTLFAGTALAKPVNINQADAQTIADSLAGIGLKKAEAIVQRRQELGSFKSVDELLDIKGIGPKTLDKIRADILLSDEPPAPATPPASQPPAPTKEPAK